MQSAENCITPFAHVEGVGEFVGKPKIVQGTDHRHEFTHADRLNPSVDLACFIADPDDHGITATVTGAFVRSGQYFVIVGSKAYPLDELRLHSVLSSRDVGEIAYVLKYLRKAIKGGDF